jgi:hypothetical protein
MIKKKSAAEESSTQTSTPTVTHAEKKNALQYNCKSAVMTEPQAAPTP